MKRVVIVLLSICLLLSACGQGEMQIENSHSPDPKPYIAAVEPETLIAEAPAEETLDDLLQWWETHIRIIPGEPEENAENHLMLHGYFPLYLHTAYYRGELTVEYYTCDGAFAPPSWSTLLVYKNGRVYPLHSLEANRFVWSITGGKLHGDEGYTIWVKTSNAAGFTFYKYTFDYEKDAFIETITHNDYRNAWPESRFNIRMGHSLE